jgi:hypothetical protein
VAVTDLVSDWRKTWAQWGAANDAGRSVTARNKIMDRIWALGREIAIRPDLHEPVEALCAPNQEPDTRLHAALVREHWDSAGAAETLVAIIRDSGATLERPLTMSSALSINTTQTAKSAALCLFNIDRSTGNIGAVS